MRKVPFAFTLTVAWLSLCTLPVQSAGIDVNPVIPAEGDVINDRLGLRGYPGSTIVRQEQEAAESETHFEIGVSLEAVFDHFDRQFSGQGWRRGNLEFRPNKVEAEYRRRGDEVDLELNRHGSSGRYTLEIEFDTENEEDDDDDDHVDDDDDNDDDD